MSFWTVFWIVVWSFVLYIAIGLFINWICACINTYIYGDRDLDSGNWYCCSAFFWPVMWPGLGLFILGCIILDVLNQNMPRVYIFQVRGRVGDYNGSLVPTSVGNYFKATYKRINWPPQQTDMESLSNFMSIDGWRKVNDTTWTKLISKKSVSKFYLEEK